MSIELEIDLDANARAVEADPIEMEPIPAIAPADDGIAVMPFQLALPDGEGQYTASFRIEAYLSLDGVLVRYGSFTPVRCSFLRRIRVEAGDILIISIRRHSSSPSENAEC